MMVHRWSCPEGHFEIVAADIGMGMPGPHIYNCPTVIALHPNVVVCRQPLVHTVASVSDSVSETGTT
jgi:hypothetical protein